MQTQWKIEPHTLAKHEILKRYLSAWYPILSSSSANEMLYVDGFCGPGRYQNGEDGSPIIALREALKHSQRLQKKRITFLFIDESSDRIAHLNTVLNKWTIPNNFYVDCKTGQFDCILVQLLDDLQQKNLNLAPTFAFIDPFGFKGTPFDLVSRLLQNPKTEVFINISVDSINRFLEHHNPQTRQHIIDLFGTSNVLKIAQSGSDRVDALRTLYQQQLQRFAKFVRYFEMIDSRGKVIYYLFFATNHRLGHIRMKDAFWKVDPSSGFKFSDLTNPNQLVLLDIDPAIGLAEELMALYQGNIVSVRDIRLYVEDKTPFGKKHMRNALIVLESDGRICVKSRKLNGTKRRKGTYPDSVIIDFEQNP